MHFSFESMLLVGFEPVACTQSPDGVVAPVTGHFPFSASVELSVCTSCRELLQGPPHGLPLFGFLLLS